MLMQLQFGILLTEISNTFCSSTDIRTFLYQTSFALGHVAPQKNVGVGKRLKLPRVSLVVQNSLLQARGQHQHRDIRNAQQKSEPKSRRRMSDVRLIQGIDN